VPVVDALATHDSETASLTLLAVNRSTDEPAELTVDVGPLPGSEVVEMVVLSDEDPGAVNTLRHPDRVVPRPGQWRIAGKEIVLVLPPVSWSMLRISTG
jgi:alpha-N-arabinofuranosidase